MYDFLVRVCRYIDSIIAAVTCRKLGPIDTDELLRSTARSSPNAFIEYCFETPVGRIEQADFHREWQQLFTDNISVGIHAPRGHGATCQLLYRVLWELGKNPDLRVKYVADVLMSAEYFLSAAQDAIQFNPRVLEVFPEMAIDFDYASDSVLLLLNRKTPNRGPSISAHSIYDCAQDRADILIFDSIEGYNAQIPQEKTLSAVRTVWLPMLSVQGRTWMVNPYIKRDDVLSILNSDGLFDAYWCKPAIWTEERALWPAWWSKEKLEARKKNIGTEAFNRQYLMRTPEPAPSQPSSSSI